MAISTILFTALTRLGVSARSAFVSKCRLISQTPLTYGKLMSFKLADIGEGIREVTVKEWFVKPGDKVSQFDRICEVQSDKASVAITSRYNGVIKKLHYHVEDTCLVGSALVEIELEDENKKEFPELYFKPTLEQTDKYVDSIQIGKIGANDSFNINHEHPIRKVLTTPVVRKISKENEVDLARVPATGKYGRILEEDILAYLGEAAVNMDAENDGEKNPLLAIDKIRHLKVKKFGKYMWKSMTQSLTIPHFVYSDEYDVSKLVRLRSEVKEAFKVQGLNITYLPFFIKAISRALSKFPELNACINEKSQFIDIKEEHNISIAMQTIEGLVVPNIKNVQNLRIVDIVRELNRLQKLGRKALIPLADLTNGTFSISNIGIIGGTYTKPVILSPQVAIGALGQIKKLPRFNGKNKVIAVHILTISWSADHRVIDGATMAKFSNLCKYYIENPSHLIIDI